MVYSIKFSNRMTNDNYISKLKVETVFSIHFWGLLSFCQISSEGSVIQEG
jgi:hypothetical protein